MTSTTKQSGFTLIEMALVLLIMGLIVGSVFAFYSPQLEGKRLQLTLDRQTKIARALSDYALRVGKLPCPGDPNPAGPAVLGDARATCPSPANRNGIVPFRELGLTQDDATDGFGNPYTYAVAPAAETPDMTQVHINCRTNATATDWVQSGANVNRNKAALCCQRVNAPGNQLRVYNDGTMTAHVTPIQIDTTPSGTFSAVDNGATPAVTTDNLRYFTYVLVSHGKNGEGSYIFNQTARKTISSAAGTAEMENADDDNDFVSMPRSSAAGANYFDDVVLWRTQQNMMTELGSTSCAIP